MSESCQIEVPMEEMVALNPVPGAGVEQLQDTGNQVINSSAPCCSDKYHRRLAISSIICGFSCCGVPALIYSLEAEQADKAEEAEQTTDRKAAKYLKQAKKLAIVSIVMWVSMLVLILLVVLLLVLLLQDCN